jgi:hypothetical protein
MFLVSHSLDFREKEIRGWVSKNPSIALVVAVVYFEWTLCRAIVGLSHRPNREVRKDLEKSYGLDAYKDIWSKETTHLGDAKSLPEIIKDWYVITEAFKGRNRLVHGRDHYTQNMVRPGIDAILAAVRDLCFYSESRGVDVNKRLPQRRRKKPVEKS